MTIVGLHHVQVNVAAELADEAEHFYEQTLGFERMRRPESLSDAGRSGVWYRCGDGELHVFLNPDPSAKPENSSRHPAFLVNDLGALQKRLEAAGVDLEEAIPIDGRERFFCRDPFGNRLEFLSFT
jgi:catechol 2,3-dioxygenase-like lactoylglutathione lyase family enzyme